MRRHGPEPVLGLDRRIHTATRLVIMSALEHHGESDFRRLGELTGVQRPNIAAQVRQLEEAGLVEVEGKEADLRLRHVRLSRKGRRCLEAHWRRLDEVRRGVAFRVDEQQQQRVDAGRRADDSEEEGRGVAR